MTDGEDGADAEETSEGPGVSETREVDERVGDIEPLTESIDAEGNIHSRSIWNWDLVSPAMIVATYHEIEVFANKVQNDIESVREGLNDDDEGDGDLDPDDGSRPNPGMGAFQ